MGWVVNDTPLPHYPREWRDTHCIGGWVGPRAGLDGCGKPHLHWDSIPGPFSPYPVAILKQLSLPTFNQVYSEVRRFSRNAAYFICP